MSAASELVALSLPLLLNRWTIGLAFLLGLFVGNYRQAVAGSLLANAAVAVARWVDGWLQADDVAPSLSWEVALLSFLAAAAWACALLAIRRRLEAGRTGPFAQRLVQAMRGAVLGAGVGVLLGGLAGYGFLALVESGPPDDHTRHLPVLAALAGGLAGVIVGGALGRRASLWYGEAHWRQAIPRGSTGLAAGGGHRRRHAHPSRSAAARRTRVS